MEEEEDAELQEAIRRSMNDYNAVRTAAAAHASWSPAAASAASSSPPSLQQQQTQRSFHMPLQQQQQCRLPIHVPVPLPPLQQPPLQLRSPSSSLHGTTLRRGVLGFWEGSSSPSLSAAASPLRSPPRSAAAAAASSSSHASPFPPRAAAAAGSGRAGGVDSASVAAIREHKGGTAAGPAAAGSSGLPATGKFAAVHAAAATGQTGGTSWHTERTPSSLNWLCDAEELFPPRQQRVPLQHQQYHPCPQRQQQQQQQHSPSLPPAASPPVSSSLSLRQQQQYPAQVRQLQVSEPYLQLARQQQELQEQLHHQHHGREEGGYACVVTGGSEEDENVALQKAIQESLLSCPSFRPPQQLTAPHAAAKERDAKTTGGGAASGGGTARGGEAAAGTTQEGEEEQLQQQYELQSPSSSRLLSLPAGALCAARGYPEDISEFLLPPPQHLEVREREMQREKRGTLQQQLLQQQLPQRGPRTQQQQQEEAELHAAAAGSGELARSQKSPTDRCKTPVNWIREEEAEEVAREKYFSSPSSVSCSPAARAGGSRLCVRQPAAAPAAPGSPPGSADADPGRGETAADAEAAGGAPQQQPSNGTTNTNNSSNPGVSSLRRSRERRKQEEAMRKLLLQKMQLLPAEPDLKELLDIVFGEAGTNREIDPSDLSRWFHHPFLFAGDVPAPSLSSSQREGGEEEEGAECEWLVNSSLHWREKAGCCLWGLVQLHGGPCGLLAAVQCFLLRALLFSPGRVKRYARLLMLQRRHQQQDKQQAPQHPRQSQQQQQHEREEEAVAEDEDGDAWSQGGQRRRAVSSSRRNSRTWCREKNNTATSGRKGEDGGQRNVELSSLLPSPLTRRHVLVEALAAVLYQSTPVSLYTVAYVLPAHVQQPAAPAAEEETLLLPRSDSSSSSRTDSAAAGDAAAEKEEAAAGGGAAAAAAAASSSALARQMSVETENAGGRSEEKDRGQEGERERRKKEQRKEEDGESVSEMLEDVQVYVHRFTHIEDVMHFYSQFYDVLLARETGVISFLFSVLLTRGIQQVASDMDMPGHSLIGVYGHCSQDLVNLLLLGAASSNVFDGDRKLGSFSAPAAAASSSSASAAAAQPKDGAAAAKTATGGRGAEGAAGGEGEEREEEEEDAATAGAAAARGGAGRGEAGTAGALAATCRDQATAEKRKCAGQEGREEEEEHTHLKGVRKRPLAGFLSEMEALRYCEVGSRYKHPHFPLWVVGSSNHYTTLFSRDLLAAAVPPARLAEIEAQAAFRDFDRDGNFLILTEHLAALLAQLGQQERLVEAQRATSAAEGVVLLSDFLKWYSDVVTQQRSQSGEDVEPPQKFTVYIYDGQTPPGPSLRRFLVEARSDSSSSNSSSSIHGEAEAEEMRRLLSTRWPGAAVSELPLLPLDLSSAT